MDEELVSTHSSVKRGGASERPSSLFAYLCPFYMSYGMSYEDFWFGELDLAKYYREKHDLELTEKNQELWLQGRYFLDALACIMSKDAKYPEEPYPMTAEEQKERKERDAYLNMQRYMAQFMQINNSKKEG